MTSLPVAMDHDYYEQIFICPTCKSFSSEPTCRNNHVITIDDDDEENGEENSDKDTDYDNTSQSSISSLLAQFVSVGYKIVPDPSALQTEEGLRWWRPAKPSFLCHECGVESPEPACSGKHDDVKIPKDVCDRCAEEFDSASEFLRHKVSAHPVEVSEGMVKTEPEEVVVEEVKAEEVAAEVTLPTLVEMPTEKVPKVGEKFTHLVLKGTLGIGQYQVMTSTAGFVYPEIEEKEEDILEWDDSIELAVLTSGGESTVSLAKTEEQEVGVKKVEPPKVQPSPEIAKPTRQFLRCLKCETEFPHVEDLIHHPCPERDQFPGFQCQYCQRWYVKEQWFARHMQVHINLLPLTCPKCDEGYLTREALDAHRCPGQKQQKKPEKYVIDAAKRNENKILPHYYICQICNISLRSERQLNLHLHIHELAKANAIKLAMEQMKAEQQKKKQLKQQQPEEKKEKIPSSSPEPTNPESIDDTTTTATSEGSKPPSKQIHIFECNICSITMRSIEEVRIHLATHASNRLYKCESCNGRFGTTRELQQHKCPRSPPKARAKRKAKDLGSRKGEGARPKKLEVPKKEPVSVEEEHKCTHCGKVFGQAAGLACHAKEEHGGGDPEGRFQCEKCPLKFKILRSLIVHRAKFH